MEVILFTLKQELNASQRSKFLGESVSIGKSVDAMGIPYYMSQMNQFLRSFTKAFNDIERGDAADPAVDLNGKEIV